VTGPRKWSCDVAIIIIIQKRAKKLCYRFIVRIEHGILPSSAKKKRNIVF